MLNHKGTSGPKIPYRRPSLRRVEDSSGLDVGIACCTGPASTRGEYERAISYSGKPEESQ